MIVFSVVLNYCIFQDRKCVLDKSIYNIIVIIAEAGEMPYIFVGSFWQAHMSKNESSFFKAN